MKGPRECGSLVHCSVLLPGVKGVLFFTSIAGMFIYSVLIVDKGRERKGVV